MSLQTPAPTETPTLPLTHDGIPAVEMETSSSSWEAEVYDLPERPADDVWAVRERCHPHDVWERSRHLPVHWFNARTGEMRTWRKLIADKAPLARFDYDITVYMVRPDGEQVTVDLYTNEPAAYAAARGTRRVHPWHVHSRPD